MSKKNEERVKKGIKGKEKGKNVKLKGKIKAK